MLKKKKGNFGSYGMPGIWDTAVTPRAVEQKLHSQEGKARSLRRACVVVP